MVNQAVCYVEDFFSVDLMQQLTGFEHVIRVMCILILLHHNITISHCCGQRGHAMRIIDP
jgi:hypothetical protein